MTPTLSADVVTAAGVRLVATQGWSTLSLRAVAAELGVTPMALYRHIGDSETLSASVVEAVVARTDRVVATGDLAGDLQVWARRFHEELGAFPGVAGWLLTHWFESGETLERIDELLGLALAHGIEGFDAVAVVNAVFTYVLMRCEAEREVRSAGVVKRQLRTSASSRSLATIRSLASHYTTAQLDAHFEFGLQALLAGMRLGGDADP